MTEEHTRRHGKDLRKGRVSLPGHAYHVTTVTHGRTPVFLDLYPARALINALREAQTRDEATTLVFVVMPDHMHWLMQLGVDTSLASDGRRGESGDGAPNRQANLAGRVP